MTDSYVRYFCMVAHLTRQREFSLKTFGPGTRTAGVLNHIKKELVEVEAKPHDLSEWADILILAADGALRMGFTPEEIVAALVAKQTKNESRTWPDWRKFRSDQAIEHDRSAEAVHTLGILDPGESVTNAPRPADKGDWDGDCS